MTYLARTVLGGRNILCGRHRIIKGSSNWVLKCEVVYESCPKIELYRVSMQ